MRTLIVVDMQKDFIDGALGTPEAVAIVPNVKKKIQEYHDAGDNVIYTYDTHGSDYLHTHEGKNLPVPHCINGTEGWQISSELTPWMNDKHVYKKCFGYNGWAMSNYGLQDCESIELVGLVADICVISNALILRSLFPECKIIVDSKCTAGTTNENYQSALNVMRSCQIEVI